MACSYIYRNLTKQCYSEMVRGLVVMHHDKLIVENATFVVRPAGRERVRATGVKNVHAFVKGHARAWSEPPPDAVKVAYNPYYCESFVIIQGHDAIPVQNAKRVYLSQAGLFAVL